MGSEKLDFKHIGTCAGAMVAYLIGSGFATGQEIMQFFTSYGLGGIGALVIAFAIMTYCSAVIMEDSHRMQLTSAGSIFTHYCGRWLGGLITFYIPFLLFSIFVIMISGAGATLSEYYGINPYVGRVVMSVLAASTAALGLNKLTKIIGRIGPLIIAFVVVIGLISIFGSDTTFQEATQTAVALDIPRAAPTWWISGFLYSAFCTTTAVSFFAGMGTQAKGRKNARISGFLGGALFIGAAIVINLGMLFNVEELVGREIPVLYMADHISSVSGIIFSMVLICGIYTTAVPMLWSTVNIFSKDGTKRARTLCVLLTLVAFCFGLLPFETLVNAIYPFSGYVGAILIFGIILSRLKERFALVRTSMSIK